jgi:hypothetical protein
MVVMGDTSTARGGGGMVIAMVLLLLLLLGQGACAYQQGMHNTMITRRTKINSKLLSKLSNMNSLSETPNTNQKGMILKFVCIVFLVQVSIICLHVGPTKFLLPNNAIVDFRVLCMFRKEE